MWIARIQWRKRPLKTTETTIQGLKAANNKHQRKNRHRKAFVTNLLFRYTKYCMRPNVITKEENNWKTKSPKTKYKTRHKYWLHMHINDDNTLHYSFLTVRVNSTAYFHINLKSILHESLCAPMNCSKTFQFCKVFAIDPSCVLSTFINCCIICEICCNQILVPWIKFLILSNSCSWTLHRRLQYYLYKFDICIDIFYTSKSILLCSV